MRHGKRVSIVLFLIMESLHSLNEFVCAEICQCMGSAPVPAAEAGNAHYALRRVRRSLRRQRTVQEASSASDGALHGGALSSNAPDSSGGSGGVGGAQRDAVLACLPNHGKAYRALSHCLYESLEKLRSMQSREAGPGNALLIRCFLQCECDAAPPTPLATFGSRSTNSEANDNQIGDKINEFNHDEQIINAYKVVQSKI